MKQVSKNSLKTLKAIKHESTIREEGDKSFLYAFFLIISIMALGWVLVEVRPHVLWLLLMVGQKLK